MKVQTKSVVCILLVLIAVGCSRSDALRVARIAATGDMTSAQVMVAERAARYALDPAALERDIKAFTRLVETFRRAVGSEWGEKEIKEPGPKEYVKYTENYKSRASVDFDRGIITVETLDQKHPLHSLRTAIVTTLLTPDDPRTVDLYSAKPVKLGSEPFLFKEVKDHTGIYIRWRWRAEQYADYLLENVRSTRMITVGSEQRIVHFVSIAMEKDHREIRAEKYRPLVERFASQYGVSKNLIYAIMKTESNFNPFAVSHAPAFGLMQIVPATAGQDVYLFLNNRKGIPSKQLLFNPEHNIHYGTVYLHLLRQKYLKDISNSVSLEYCIISAYNAGAGAVLETFACDRAEAPGRINALNPGQVYEKLRYHIPKEEARRYLAKVIDAKKDFVNY